jgi:hypothetical protein
LRIAQRKARRRKDRIVRMQSRLEFTRKIADSRGRAIDQYKAELELYRDGGPPARPEKYEYLFVMAFQRSGSTLLQAILNSIPGYLIRGENGGLLQHPYAFHRAAQEQKRVRSFWADDPGFPFFGISDYPDDVALASIRDQITATLLRPLPDSRVLGFKEVNWHVDDLDDYVDFFREVFPGARFIGNTRRVEDSAQSRWFAKRDDSVEYLTNQRERIVAATNRLGDDAFHLQYDDYVNEPAQLAGLFEWLGEDFDIASVERVMSTRYA